MFLAMSSNRFHHTYHSPRLTVGDWRDSRLPAGRVLEMMSAILNSNESFQLDDSFHVEISLVELPSRASGQLTLKNKCLDSLIRKRKSVISIRNTDELCTARALVPVKAKVDNDPHFDDIKRGRPIQIEISSSPTSCSGGAARTLRS